MSIFNTKSANEVLGDPSKRSRMSVGIHSNCYLDTVEIAKSKSNVDFMDFIFVKKDDNSTTTQRIWFPNGNPQPVNGESPEQALEKEIKGKLAHIVKIMNCFVNKDSDINAGSFMEFCEIAKSKIEKSGYKTQPVYLKLIYDKDGIFTQFPKFPNYIQKQVDGEPCMIEISKWEKENRMTAAEIKAPKEDNPLIDTSELPF